MSLSPLVLMLGFVVGQRIGELVIARRNTRRLLARGGVEIGAAHYPLFVILHLAWIASLAAFIPLDRQPYPALIGVYFALQLARVWVMTSLGPWWTTRIIHVPDAPLVRRGPYRFVRHPNYIVVAGEIAVLPLAFGAWKIALLFSLLSAILTLHRIGVEDEALRTRA